MRATPGSEPLKSTGRGDRDMTAKKVAFSFVLLLVSAVFGAAQQPTSSPARPTPPPTPHTNLKVGDAAPNFTLPSTIVQDGKRMRYQLSDFKGKKNVVLAF